MTRDDDRRTGRITPTTRETACLALGHDDADEPRCRVLDEDLVRQLVEEVQGLRVAAGIVEETETDRAEAVGALEDAITAGWSPEGEVVALDVLDHLTENGWTLHPVRRPV